MIEFTVYGRPVPQGSMKTIKHRHSGVMITIADNQRMKPWRQQIAETAIAMRFPIFDRETPLDVTLNFYFTRPKSAKKRRGMIVKPDVDKLVRAFNDSVKGVLIADDAQIVEQHARKHYGGPERIEIRIQEAII